MASSWYQENNGNSALKYNMHHSYAPKIFACETCSEEKGVKITCDDNTVLCQVVVRFSIVATLQVLSFNQSLDSLLDVERVWLETTC